MLEDENGIVFLAIFSHQGRFPNEVASNKVEISTKPAMQH